MKFSNFRRRPRRRTALTTKHYDAMAKGCLLELSTEPVLPSRYECTLDTMLQWDADPEDWIIMAERMGLFLPHDLRTYPDPRNAIVNLLNREVAVPSNAESEVTAVGGTFSFTVRDDNLVMTFGYDTLAEGEALVEAFGGGHLVSKVARRRRGNTIMNRRRQLSKTGRRRSNKVMRRSKVDNEKGKAMIKQSLFSDDYWPEEDHVSDWMEDAAANYPDVYADNADQLVNDAVEYLNLPFKWQKDEDHPIWDLAENIVERFSRKGAMKDKKIMKNYNRHIRRRMGFRSAFQKALPSRARRNLPVRRRLRRRAFDDYGPGEEPMPEPRDSLVIQQSRHGYDFIAEGRYLATYEFVEDALEAARDWMRENMVFLDLLFINERGNVDLIHPEDGSIIESWV